MSMDVFVVLNAHAILMNENINDSEKFERYHLLNYIYGKNL